MIYIYIYIRERAFQDIVEEQDQVQLNQVQLRAYEAAQVSCSSDAMNSRCVCVCLC